MSTKPDPILTQIEDKMYDLIKTMQLGTYNFRWNTVNEQDMAKSTFPQALIYLENESNLDERDGTWGQAYFNECTFRIEVRPELDKEYTNPVSQINREFNLALDDFKQLFGRNWNLVGASDTIMYTGSTREYEVSNDIFIPGKLITTWLVRYEQDRFEPTTVCQ